MQTIRGKPEAVWTDLLPVLAGIAVAISGVGLALALADVRSPLRAPFILFFLFAGPAGGLTAALPGLEPAARASAAATGALVIDVLAAQTASSLHVLTVGGAVIAVVAITALLFLLSLGRRIRKTELINPVDRLMKGIKGTRSGRFRI
ncbi:hypothetical protein HRW18_27760 [Streptomyces lunaelactis]|uniref:hypothetical protein n=1 Tax=Streptomyces lunaelactis TaxID=1535768 RepID=UPI0015847EA6|nr:hypothetical protein [Streptomyces lunaelactis]NUK00153.1 hypothetical protein [Streptomyces lunaelactis]NUK11703.1 hypothetical protein [Streptomyces lunaelactis]NUK14142.1 hypothetical protein [Streptomyces lunaelactis]NUK54346.1 hypothetical protein [Streptomyces lunaelactis]NUK61176.1 hypothetical protein [Streptomyces lunaelactis]